jgi:type II secretory pathway component HofQ
MVAAICLVASITLGQTPKPTVARDVSPAPLVANPCADAGCASAEEEPADTVQGDADRIEHLRLAIEHLEAAGCGELAKQIDRELLIEIKLAQIRRLQEEVDSLRTGVKSPPSLQIQLKVVELKSREMHKQGFTFSTTSDGLLDLLSEQDPKQESVTSPLLLKTNEVEQVLEALTKAKLARVLAEPTLVTVSGRPASFQSGGEIPIIVPQSMGTKSVEYRQTGTRVDCVGTILDNGRVRLELRSTVSEVDLSRSILLEDISVPGLRSRAVDTAVEMAAGQTAVLCGMVHRTKADVSQDDEESETSLLVAVTVDVVDASVTAAKEQPLR